MPGVRVCVSVRAYARTCMHVYVTLLEDLVSAGGYTDVTVSPYKDVNCRCGCDGYVCNV